MLSIVMGPGSSSTSKERGTLYPPTFSPEFDMQDWLRKVSRLVDLVKPPRRKVPIKSARPSSLPLFAKSMTVDYLVLSSQLSMTHNPMEQSTTGKVIKSLPSGKSSNFLAKIRLSLWYKSLVLRSIRSPLAVARGKRNFQCSCLGSGDLLLSISCMRTPPLSIKLVSF